MCQRPAWGTVVFCNIGGRSLSNQHASRRGHPSMNVFWRESKPGEHLMLQLDNGDLIRVGFILRTPRGFDALAQTHGYAPERSKNDFATIEEARRFVESFKPWEEFGGTAGLRVEPRTRPRA